MIFITGHLKVTLADMRLSVQRSHLIALRAAKILGERSVLDAVPGEP
jgi:hypothetical protein